MTCVIAEHYLSWEFTQKTNNIWHVSKQHKLNVAGAAVNAMICEFNSVGIMHANRLAGLQC